MEGPDLVVLRTPVMLRGIDFKRMWGSSRFSRSDHPFRSDLWRIASAGAETDRSRELSPRPRHSGGNGRAAQSAGEWAEPVIRSLITLKALTYRPSGGIVAAPTTSLPERLGGTRNWDYRFCWLRDATFTLLTLMNAGYYEDARAWREWLLRAAAGDPAQMQIMYGITGERRLTEWAVPWLSGYEDAQPVASAMPRQINCSSTFMAKSSMRSIKRIAAGWLAARGRLDVAAGIAQHLEAVWSKRDAGIWEVRSAPQHFTYSKVMAWVAFDRAVKDVEPSAWTVRSNVGGRSETDPRGSLSLASTPKSAHSCRATAQRIWMQAHC